MALECRAWCTLRAEAGWIRLIVTSMSEDGAEGVTEEMMMGDRNLREPADVSKAH